VTLGFKDHFSTRPDDYARYRPTYPDELFEYLASVVEERSVAWDCATGSGQAAVALARYFPRIIASDASESQVAAAIPHPQVTYRVAAAEQSGLADNSVDLLTVGQAFHWFDEAMFLSEAQRVLKSSGVLAIWCYEICLVTDKCDAIIDTLYRDIVGDFWPPERVTIEQGYASVRLPGEAIVAPRVEMTLNWRVEDMLGYLGTWSACKHFKAEKGSDPVALIAAPLADAWGKGEHRVSWPLQIKVCRANTLLE